MPEFVKHEKDWDKARKEADKQQIPKKGDRYWKYVTGIYKKMHPEDFSKAAADAFKVTSGDYSGKAVDSTKETFKVPAPKTPKYDFSKGIPFYASRIKWNPDIKVTAGDKVPFPGAASSPGMVVNTPSQEASNA